MEQVDQKGLLEALQKYLGGKIIYGEINTCGETSVSIEPGALEATLLLLKNSDTLQFEQLIDICGVDYPHKIQRFEVVYHLLSMTYNVRLRIKVSLKDGESLPSVEAIYPCSGWWEREVYDMFGIEFTGHSDLRRILTDYGFEGFPLRKDFPVSGYTQVRFDEKIKEVVKEPVDLPQAYREFEFSSPWQGEMIDRVLKVKDKA